MRGRLIAIEGVDGSGKTTLAAALHESLPGSLLTSEPYEEVNQLGDALWDVYTYTRDRALHCRDLITPALDAGQDVICDRYYGSTAVYQWPYGEQMGTSEILAGRIDEPWLLVLVEPPSAKVCMQRVSRRDGGVEEIDRLNDLHDRYETWFPRALAKHRIKVAPHNSLATWVGEAMDIVGAERGRWEVIREWVRRGDK